MNMYENPNDMYPDDTWHEPPRQGDGGGHGWLGALRDLWHWDNLAAEIGQENQARVAFVGLPGAGKSLLFNRLRGWDISHEPILQSEEWMAGLIPLESLGMFLLADLPVGGGSLTPDRDVVMTLGDPALLVYLVDGERGVTSADYRWVATLRASGRPVVAVLNKVDLLDDTAAALAVAGERLGMTLLPISALTGQGVEEDLLPAMLDAAPRLAVPLGRELVCLRQMAARRIIRQTAVLAGIMGAEPVPLLDLPVQIMLQVGVVMRVGAAFGAAPSGGLNREVLGTIAGSLGIRYLAAAVIKVIPVMGWAVAGLLSSGATLLIGEAALRYYAAGGSLSFTGAWPRPRRRRWLPVRRLPPVDIDENETTILMLPEEGPDADQAPST